MFVVVVRRSGPQWDASRPLEEQSDWPAHASFMDGLVDAGFIVLGGPLAAGDRVVHVVEAESEDAIRDTLARDPWSETHLHIDTIDRWMIRLDGRRDLLPRPIRRSLGAIPPGWMTMRKMITRKSRVVRPPNI